MNPGTSPYLNTPMQFCVYTSACLNYPRLHKYCSILAPSPVHNCNARDNEWIIVRSIFRNKWTVGAESTGCIPPSIHYVLLCSIVVERYSIYLVMYAWLCDLHVNPRVFAEATAASTDIVLYESSQNYFSIILDFYESSKVKFYA